MENRTYTEYEKLIKQKSTKDLTEKQKETYDNFSVAMSSNPGTQAMFKFLNNANVQLKYEPNSKGKIIVKGTYTEETRHAKIEIIHVDYSKVLEKEATNIIKQLKEEQQDLYKRNKNSLFDLKFLALLEQYALYNASQDDFNEKISPAITLVDTDLADKFNMSVRSVHESLNGVTRNRYKYNEKTKKQERIQKHYIGTIENLNDIRLDVKFKTKRNISMDTPGGLQPYTISRIKDKANKKVGLVITINSLYLMYERLYLKNDDKNGAYERLPYFIWTIDNSTDFMIIKYCYDLLRNNKNKARNVKVKNFLDNVGIVDDTGRNARANLYEPFNKHISKINKDYKDFINIDYEQREFEAIDGTIDFEEWKKTNLVITYKKTPLYETIESNKKKYIEASKDKKNKEAV